MFASALIAAGLLLGAIPGKARSADTPYRQDPYVGAIAIDAVTGRTLCSDRCAQACYPASCTKLMTAYLALKAIRAGTLARTDRLVQSAVSFRERPSWLGIEPGTSISVEDGLKALMVQSANDVAVMFAERLAGSTEAFVAAMNREARLLKMADTVYVTPNGYPPPKGSKRGFDRSTAADLAKLARALLREFPEIVAYTSIETLTIGGVVNREGRLLEMRNHNHLLMGDRNLGISKMPGVDGLKTGYHDAGGSSIVLTGTRQGKRAIVVIVGSSSSKARDTAAARFLDDALTALSW